MAAEMEGHEINYYIMDKLAMILSLISEKKSYVKTLKQLNFLPYKSLLSGDKQNNSNNLFDLGQIILDMKLGGCLSLLGLFLSEKVVFEKFVKQKSRYLISVIEVLNGIINKTSTDNERENDQDKNVKIRKTILRSTVLREELKKSIDPNYVKGVARAFKLICSESSFIDLLDVNKIDWLGALIDSYSFYADSHEYTRSWITKTLNSILKSQDHLEYFHKVLPKHIVTFASTNDCFSRIFGLRLLNMHLQAPHIPPKDDYVFPEKTGNLYYNFDEKKLDKDDCWNECNVVFDERVLYGYKPKTNKPLFKLYLNEWKIIDASNAKSVIMKLTAENQEYDSVKKSSKNPQILNIFLKSGENVLTKEWLILFNQGKKVVELSELHTLDIVSKKIQGANRDPEFPVNRWNIPLSYNPWYIKEKLGNEDEERMRPGVEIQSLVRIIENEVPLNIHFLVQFSQFLAIVAQSKNYY